jgi:hypothetical protein
VVPEECNNKTFEKLFKFLLDKGLVTLGLYRLKGATDNTYEYVYTNPESKTPVTQRDRVFVLGRDIQKELIVDHKESNEFEIPKEEAQSSSNNKLKSDVTNQVVHERSKDFYGVNQLKKTINSSLHNDIKETI